MADLNVVSTILVSKTKAPPQKSKIPLKFVYFSRTNITGDEKDQTDENLLILLHGLGDTLAPFANLGKRLNLPQTAILALEANEKIPFLYEDEEGYQWYESFDQLGDQLSNPNPTAALYVLLKILRYLVEECSWPPNRIHLFGFGQGGGLAAELGLRWWKQSLEQARKGSKQIDTKSGSEYALASIVTISGPLLEHPTLPSTSRCPTPLLVFHRSGPASLARPDDALASFRKGYAGVKETKVNGGQGMPAGNSMSRSTEWEGIMKFWGENLARRQMEGLHEVTGGTPSVS